MFKYLLLSLIILLSFNTVLGDTIHLPYTESSNFTKISIDYNDDNYTILTTNENEIYEIFFYYTFGTLTVDEGIYINNISFTNNYINVTISEKYNITDAFLSKKVNYELILYENNILTSTNKNEYYVFSTSCFFAKSTYTFDKYKIIINNKYSDLSGYVINEYTLTLSQPLSLTKVFLNSSVPDKGIYTSGRNIWIEYIKTGIRPKSYFINQLHPILQLPYKTLSFAGIDKENNILNMLLIISYILKSLFFWLKVIYTSLFTIIVLILIGVIPFISLTQTNNRNNFINKLISNYVLFFNIIINIVKYTINLIISLIGLIPFI